MTEDRHDFEIIQFSSSPTDGLAALLRIIDRHIREAVEGRNRGEAHQGGAVIVRVGSERSERPAASGTSVTYDGDDK